ncbi:MAG: WYL domain-containing protein [Anaerovoracaceae bacterium]|nr:WYL domain-containing protein [Anaerovoracaceae bacterium]
MNCMEVMMLLFSEIYGTYFKVVAGILDKAINGELNEKQIYRTVEELAFDESVMNIPQSIMSKEWPLITDDYSTPVKNCPDMPLTNIQKRWLKSILNDPKIKLFDVSDKGLEDVKPLFDRNIIVFFDQYTNGDDFENPEYVRNFRIILQAFKERRYIRIKFMSVRTGKIHEWECAPHRLEYSLKDDKFRFITSGPRYIDTINVGNIIECSLSETYADEQEICFRLPKETLVLELLDERNALERVMLHFSHLQKETVKLDDGRYRITLIYDAQDEIEMLIRILSFGPMIKVVEPQSFINRIKERLTMQRQL